MVVALLKMVKVVSNTAVWTYKNQQRLAVLLTTSLFKFKGHRAPT